MSRSADLIGAVETSTALSAPLRWDSSSARRLLLLRPGCSPVESVLCVPVARVAVASSSSTSSTISASDLPTAKSALVPVSEAAAEFMKSMTPDSSVVTTASLRDSSARARRESRRAFSSSSAVMPRSVCTVCVGMISTPVTSSAGAPS